MELIFRYKWFNKWFYIDTIKDNLKLAFKDYEERPKPSKLYLFTGLKDKNGVRIFEGDVVFYANGDESFEAIIEWQKDRACFMARTTDNHPDYFMLDEEAHHEDIQVIGCVYTYEKGIGGNGVPPNN